MEKPHEYEKRQKRAVSKEIDLQKRPMNGF